MDLDTREAERGDSTKLPNFLFTILSLTSTLYTHEAFEYLEYFNNFAEETKPLATSLSNFRDTYLFGVNSL